jgi:UDP-glucose 4-epimerase
MAPYGQSKFCAERYLALYERLYGLSSIALRFSNVYGPRQDPGGEAGVIAIFCGCFRDRRAPTIYGDGLQTRDYLYVGDLTAALIAASELSAGGVLNIGTHQETSVLDLVRLLGEIRGEDTPGPQLRTRPLRGGHTLMPGLRARAPSSGLGGEHLDRGGATPHVLGRSGLMTSSRSVR